MARADRGRRPAAASSRVLLALLGCLVGLALLLALPATPKANGDPTLGFLEVCKAADGDGVTGTFTFRVADRTVRVPVGSCSPALQVAAGEVTVTESPAPGITIVGVATVPSDDLVSADLPARTAVVRVVAGDISTETVVTFANRFEAGQLKVCKVAGPGVLEGRTFSFDVEGRSVSVPAGAPPNGLCAPAETFPVGTQVTVTEAVPAGMEVGAIDVLPAARTVGSPNLSRGRVVVTIGSGMTEATFTNQATPTAPATTLPPATVLGTTTTITVPATTTSTTTPPTTVAPTVPLATVPPTTTTTLPPGTVAPTTAPPSTVPPTTAPPTTAPPTTAPPSTLSPAATTTTAPPATVPATTVPATTVPPTSVPATTIPPATTTTTAPPAIVPSTTTTLGPTTTTVPGITATTTTVPPTSVPATTVPPRTVPPATAPATTTTVPPVTPTTVASTTVAPTTTIAPATTTPTTPTTTTLPPAPAPRPPTPPAPSATVPPSPAPAAAPSAAVPTAPEAAGTLAFTGFPTGKLLLLASGFVVLGVALLAAASLPRFARPSVAPSPAARSRRRWRRPPAALALHAQILRSAQLGGGRAPPSRAGPSAVESGRGRLAVAPV